MNILIVGAGGMLGHKTVQVLRNYGNLTATFRKAAPDHFLPAAIFDGADMVYGIDAGNHDALKRLFYEKKPDVVINASGIIKQRNEAKEAVACIAINALLPHYMEQLCEEIGAYFITLGTDCVFPCKGEGPYTEADAPSPVDLYGKSKWLGEVSGKNSLTLRMSIIGRELSTPKRSLLEWVISNQGKTVQGYTRALYTGLTTLELTHIVAMVIGRKERLTGVWHVAGPTITKHDLLLKINDIFKLGITVEPQDDFVCDRRLNGDRFTHATGYSAPSWDAMLEAVFQENSLYGS